MMSCNEVADAMHRYLDGELPDGEGKVTVGARVVLCPQRKAEPVVSLVARVVAVVDAAAGEHEAGEGELRSILIISRKRNIAGGVFDAGIFTKGASEGVERDDHGKAA
jgi:hypothetical protein